LHKIGQQESVLGSERGRIEYARLNVRARASDGKSSGVQVSNATVCLKHVLVKGYKTQHFGRPGSNNFLRAAIESNCAGAR
jgi:hypothetical protein